MGASALEQLIPAHKLPELEAFGLILPNGNGKVTAAPAKKSLFETMATIEEEEIDWLWTNRIPRGKLTLFDGDPGIGKSYASLAIAAALSNGHALPFDQEPEAALKSWIISSEDGPADTIKPRLRRLGADMDMIAVPNRDLNLSDSQITPQLIDSFLVQFPAALLVIDPIIAYAGGRNTDKASDVRGLLSQLAGVAAKHKTAIVLIRHLNKSTQSKALYRGQGSIDFAAACRSAFVFAADQENHERRLMAHTKGSVAGFQPTVEYFIDKQGGFTWGVQTSDTADEALGTGEPKRERESRQFDTAKTFLTEFLSTGTQPGNKVKAKAQEAGISNATLWRAKEELAIKASKERGSGEWWWRLP